MSSESPMLAFALEAHQLGFCVLPPYQDGSKRPAGGEWRRWQKERPGVAQLRTWYTDGRTGIGLVCGPISGELELLDFDDMAVYVRFVALAKASGLAELVERIEAGYVERTPRPAIHWLYRCPGAKSQGLAGRPGPIDPKTGRPKIITLIETKGEGGYVVIAPSNGTVHETGRPYKLLRGGLVTVATITKQERAALYQLAATFDEMERKGILIPQTPETIRPGDDFSARATWAEILEPAGWVKVYEHEGEAFWRRPGKDHGISATTDWKGNGLFCNFSTSTEFSVKESYTKFGVYATLNHEGNYSAAAAALLNNGYGGEPVSQIVTATPAQAPMVHGWWTTGDDIADYYGRVEWAWDRWIPKGHITMITGPQGVGKSYLLAYLMGCLLGDTKKWPDGTLTTDNGGDLVFVETESMRGETVRRFRLAGGQGIRLKFPGDDPVMVPELPKHIPAIQQLAEILRAQAVAVDSLSGSHALDENSAEMRQLLIGLSQVASRLKIPVVVVHHLRKKSQLEADKPTLDRVRGSSTISQFCRSVIALWRPDGSTDGPVRVESLKSTFCKPPPAFGFEIGADERLQFSMAAPEEQKSTRTVDRAIEFLRIELEVCPRKYSDLLARGEERGISKYSLYSARDKLDIVTINGVWSFPVKIGEGHP